MKKIGQNTFEWKNDNGDTLELTIKERVNKYSCVIDLKKNSEEILKNKVAHIAKYLSKPNQLFLKCSKGDGRELAICVCNKSNEDDFNIAENRLIAEYLWRNVQEYDRISLSYEFTMEHRANWED